MFAYRSSLPVHSVIVFLLVAGWIYTFGIMGHFGSRTATEKSWSTYNIRITPVSTYVRSRDNDTSTTPQIKATTVFGLSGIQYFIQGFPEVTTCAIYTTIYSNY
jgi:hypothetical protein